MKSNFQKFVIVFKIRLKFKCFFKIDEKRYSKLEENKHKFKKQETKNENYYQTKEQKMSETCFCCRFWLSIPILLKIIENYNKK